MWHKHAITHSSEGQIIEDLGTVLPCVGVGVLLLAFIIETINLCDLATLVISTEKSDFVGMSA